MAEYSESQLTVDWFGLETDVVDVSDWINGQSLWQVILYRITRGQYDHQKRGDVVHAIVHNHSLNHLERILESGWDVNETLRIPDHRAHRCLGILDRNYTHITALSEAIRRGWIEGVKMLLDAGAKCLAPHPSQNPLNLALSNPGCPFNIIELLVQHGADPNCHDDNFDNIPLLQAIKTCTRTGEVRRVEVLLEHGADPNVVSSEGDNTRPLLEALQSQESAVLFEMLIKFGANVNKAEPFIYSRLAQMMCNYGSNGGFVQDHVDLIFLHGLNINMEDSEYKTLLEHAVDQHVNSNNIRWLIYHGADTTRIPLSRALRIRLGSMTSPDTPLILLQAGVKVPHGMVRQLQYMEQEIPSYLQGNRSDDFTFGETIEGMWPFDFILKVKLENDERMQHHPRKYTFPEHLTHQMADLREFSDKNLNVYPEVQSIQCMDTKEWWQNHLKVIHTLVEFLSQPRSLQWSCRQCLRQNLVSFHPSVVKTLPIPARLKCYILCHEI